jgi:phosphohistidine phosphatase
MLIYFLRHADAIYTGDRPLSEKGHKQMAGVAKALRRLEVGVDALYTSPLRRARQTADAVAEVLGSEPQVTDLLDAGTTLRRLRELLEDCGPEARVMVVGHEPDFSEMVGGLIGGGQVDMKKAGLALVECDEVAPGAGLLRWLLPPRAMG